ncbi:MAG: hypothetical protein GDA36_00775 [Rhodobacteraceae bacterium]|nr:hypothetical protein [Paracoccaceae bacterium]
MPKPIKMMLSIVVVLVLFLAHLFRDFLGMNVGPVYLGGLCIFLVWALWVFPEPEKKKLPQR